MIHEFVDKIMVHEADKSTGDRIQQIDIYLKYVGMLDIPMLKLTPEQIKEKERKRRKRAWNRTYYASQIVFIKQLDFLSHLLLQDLRNQFHSH